MEQLAHCEKHHWRYRLGEGCLPCNRGTEEPARKSTSVERVVANYDTIKEFEGRKYTGMRVGGSHSWYYQQGEWNETKVTPDRWQFTYTVNKRRRWDAPEGSGVPVGTEYHWYILAHQNVQKLNSNEYTTSMTGVKYKLAHRRAAGEEWSAGDRAQLRRLIAILEENITLLQHALGEKGRESGAVGQEAGQVVTPMDEQQKEMVGGRRMSSKNLSPVIVRGQSPLEMYLAP